MSSYVMKFLSYKLKQGGIINFFYRLIKVNYFI
jgi:hypothetical protein